MTEFGIFGDEGCIERGFWSEAEAQAALANYAEDDGDLAVYALCGEHEEQPADGCEECQAEDEGEDE